MKSSFFMAVRCPSTFGIRGCATHSYRAISRNEEASRIAHKDTVSGTHWVPIHTMSAKELLISLFADGRFEKLPLNSGRSLLKLQPSLPVPAQPPLIVRPQRRQARPEIAADEQ